MARLEYIVRGHLDFVVSLRVVSRLSILRWTSFFVPLGVCRFLRDMAANDDCADSRMANVALHEFWSQFDGSTDI